MLKNKGRLQAGTQGRAGVRQVFSDPQLSLAHIT